MADTNTQVQGTQDQGSAGDNPVKLYASKADAEANKPADPGRKKLYCVTRPDQSTAWLWSDGYASAAHAVSRADGYTVSKGGDKEVTKEAVATKLSQFTDDELAALGLTRAKPAKGGKKQN